MPPRSYNTETRLQQQEALRQRVVDAAVQLHAEKGGLATRYADIAERAGVSLPTVHKHFPTADDLFRSCTAHAAALAPPFPAEAIAAAATLEEAAAQLAAAMDQVHAYYERWLVWREREHIQVLADLALQRRKELTDLCSAVLAAHGITADVRELAAVWESLLDFEFWHRLARDHKLPRSRVRTHIAHLMLAVCGPRTASLPLSRPTSRSSHP